MSASETLKNACAEDWAAATDHAFCKELSDGTLPLHKMKWYLAQDYKFIDQFVRLLATAVAYAPTLADGVPGAQFLAIVTGPENTYFQRSFDALEMTEAERNPPAAAVTTDFQNLMAEARTSGRYEEMVAVLCVAEWVYLTWGSRYNPPTEDLPFYFAEWITLHAGEGFESVIAWLRAQLDAVWPTLDEAAQARVQEVFSKAVELERAFFDASYEAPTL